MTAVLALIRINSRFLALSIVAGATGASPDVDP
jgi:hypothetical protein